MADSFWKDVKCVSCSKTVEKPVQLPACLHILCLECEKKLEAISAYNIYCPKCNVENARPVILQLISGVEHALEERMFCDNSQQHDIAKWFCFDCGRNLCGSCRLSHMKDHKIQLLIQPETLRNRIWDHSGDAQDAPVTDREEDYSQNTSFDTVYCPLCNLISCEHVHTLQKLTRPCFVSDCEQEGHVDKELKYFCKECWVPVCGDCSLKGKHKLHECDDMSTCGLEFVTKSLATLKEKLHMLIATSKKNIERAENDEKQLSQHVYDIDKELNSRKCKILEETEHAFNSAIRDAELQGHSILMDYNDKLNLFKKFDIFLLTIQEAFTNFTIDEQQPTTTQNVVAFDLQKFARDLIPQIQAAYQNLERPQERQLVLPEVETASITPPPTLARVGTEWKHLKLAFSFKFEDEYTVKSIVLIDSNTCLLSTKNCTGSSEYDSIVQYYYNSETQEPECKIYDTVQGDYFISQLQSGEIIASYSKGHSDASCNALKYCKLPQCSSDIMDMHVIKTFEFPPYSLAVTKDNNILLCVNADEKKGLSYLMLMNLLGNELKSTVKQQGPNMISPNYVAVSSSGEICVSDTEGSNIAILDENLAVRERMNYQLPTSISDASKYQFQPHGVCFDGYGRIIVADPHNSCVVRLLRDPGSNRYKLEPLLSESDEIIGMRLPKLVAMSKEDSRLWVVCEEHILVFDYMV